MPHPTSVESTMVPFHKEAVCRDLSNLLDWGWRNDAHIVCDGKVFRVHQNVLAVRSHALFQILEDQMAERMSRWVTIENIDGEVFGHFIKYLYSGNMPHLEPDLAQSLYEVAGLYAVDELRRACALHLLSGLTKENALDILVMADKHSDIAFKDAVVQFIIKEKIPRAYEGWSGFCDRHPELMKEVYDKCCAKFFGM